MALGRKCPYHKVWPIRRTKRKGRQTAPVLLQWAQLHGLSWSQRTLKNTTLLKIAKKFEAELRALLSGWWSLRSFSLSLPRGATV